MKHIKSQHVSGPEHHLQGIQSTKAESTKSPILILC